MRFFEHKGLIINPAQIAYASRDQAGIVTIHFVAPLMKTTSGSAMGNSSVVAASDHLQLLVGPGPDAEMLWQHLKVYTNPQ